MSNNEFTTKISGIPCICRVTHYIPYVQAKTTGRWEDAEPEEAEEFEYELHKAKGKGHLKWLEAKVTEADEIRLAEEWEATVLENKHYINEGD